MKKIKLCRISNCKNSASGVICTTHRYRWNTYKSYDLPNYHGKPNILTDIPLSEGKVNRCKIHGELTINEVYKRYYKGKISSYYCKECLISKNIKNKYKGLSSLEDYEKMLKQQNGRCAMCHTSKNNTTRNGKIKRFSIDHCHKTNRVRGLLCSFCNSLLGYCKDSIQTLESAISYLKKHSSE